MRHLSALGLVVLGLFVGCGGASGDGGSADLDAGSDTSGGGDTSGTDAGCGAGQQACGGVCVDTTSDPKNCGTCGTACSSGDSCCDGRCVSAASCGFALTSIGPAGGWQNGGDWISLGGAGFVKGMKVFIGDGRAPVQVIDGKSAKIQTPPGPLGPQDVKIVSPSGIAAILPRAFTYTSGTLGTPWAQKPMSKVRGENPAIAVLQDGRVLIAGGTTKPDSAVDALDTAEIYTRKTDKVEPAKNTMSTKRWHDNAITLLDGRVLVVGAACDGASCGADATVADLFDPTTDTFTTSKGKLNHPRLYARSVLMTDGRVFISSEGDGTVEIYDPATDAFTLVDHKVVHTYGFVVRLRDGRVLLGAGDGGVTAVETYDSDSGTFTSVGALAQGRSMLTAHTLPDGRVIVIGGSSLSAGGIHVPLSSIELFDPATGKWSTAPYKLSIGRTWLASALVRDGTILAMGGYTLDAKCDSLTDSVDQIDPVTGKVTVFAKLPNANTEWNAVTMLDGSVLGVGGGACGTATALPDLDFLPGGGGPG